METKTVDVVLVDSSNYEVTLKLNNPVDEISLSDIKSAFQNLFNIGNVKSRYGNLYTGVARATVTTITKVVLTDSE